MKIPRLSGLTDEELSCLTQELEAILEFEHDQEYNPKFETLHSIVQKVNAEKLYRIMRQLEKTVKKLKEK